NLPLKWTDMSSDQHELSRQQGVVTPPRPLVQSARLLPPPPRDSTETNGGTEKLRVEEGVVTQCGIRMPASLHVNVNISVTLTDTLIHRDPWTACGMIQSTPHLRSTDEFSIRFRRVDV
ncbi:hypothetical protein F2P81_010646, partial [Scophthalmus maximus]